MYMFNNKISELEINNKKILLELKNLKEQINNLLNENNNLKFRIIDLEKKFN